MTTATRLHLLSIGHLTLPADGVVEGATGMRRMPFPAFLIEHPDALIVYDTGLSALAYDDPETYFAPSVQHEFSADQRIDRRLAALGFAPSDVTDVVLSHAHSDHTGGLTRFPDARFHAGVGELAWAQRTIGAPFVRWEEHLAPTIDYDWREIDSADGDLLGDGSVTAVHTPGHTPGHLSLLVRLPSRSILLTGDATHLREGLTRDAIDPEDVDAASALDSLERLRAIARDGAELWIAHDPDDETHFTREPFLA